MSPELLEIAEQVGQRLARLKIRMVAAESCTGGLISAAMTSVPGSSAWFERGFVTYTNIAKHEMLGVPAELFKQDGAVSEAVVLAMARGAIERSKGHVSVAVSGIAGPDGGTADKPVGTVWVAWGQKLGYAEARCFHFDGDRAAVREASAIEALRGLEARLAGQG